MKKTNQEQSVMIKMKKYTFTFMHTQTLQITEIKAYSREGAIQQMGEQWQLVD